MIKPNSTAADNVDGAWWPRSRNLTIELASLLQGLTNDIGRVYRVSYRFDEWDPAPRRAIFGSSLVRLAGYESLRAHTVNVSDGLRWRILRVVPPDTAEDDAARALKNGAAGDDTDVNRERLAPAARTSAPSTPTPATGTDPS